MRNRFALLVSAALTAVVLTSMSICAALAADECLAKPRGLAPAGKHWYYNTDRKIQRKCWFLDDADEKVATVAPRKQPVATRPASPAPDVAQQPQNVNARAELVEEPRSEQPAASTSLAPPAQPEPRPQALQDSSDGATRRDWTVASRWPEPSDTFAPNAAPMISQPAPAVQSEKPSFAVAEVPVQQPSAAVDGSSEVDFGLIAGALILLVVMSGTIIVLNRRGSSTQGRSMRGARQRDEMPWTHPAAAGSAPAVRRPDPRNRSEVIDEIEQLLAAGRPPHPSH